MTEGEKQAWLMVYAAGWFSAGVPLRVGLVTDEARARAAAQQANRAVAALRTVDDPVVAEVLK